MTFALTVLLLLLSALHAPLITLIRTLSLPDPLLFIAGAWRELLLGLLAILTIPRLVKIFKNRDLRIRFWNSVKWFLPIFALSLIFLFIQNNHAQWLWGARYDLLLFVSVIIFALFDFSKRQKEILKKGILWTAFFVFLFGIIHALFLPKDFLMHLGYSWNRDIWDASAPISACQPLENTAEFCRAISTFGGPTRYGTYILLIMSLAGYELLRKKNGIAEVTKLFRFEPYFLSAVFLLGLVNLFLTYSRSIWIGFLAMAVTAIVLAVHSNKTPASPNHAKTSVSWSKFFLVLFGILLIFFFFTFESWRTIFVRAGSSSEHFLLLKEGWEIFTHGLMGKGLGTAGPASLHFHKLITENWYLQIGIEMGLLGLLFWIFALFGLLRMTVQKSPPLFLALVGISVAGLFTHSFEETATVLILGGLIGIFSKD